DERILAPLARIALAGADDRWTRAAVASAVPRRGSALLGTLLRQPVFGPKGPHGATDLTLVQDIATLVGTRQDVEDVAATLQLLTDHTGPAEVPLQMAILNGLADGMGRRGA